MTPNTTVTLYATPFDISNKYVIAANSQGEALAIVSSYPSKVYTDCYWQRDNDFVFRANGNINEVEQYNYCVYLNNGRYNFAFITECDYVNDAMTLVHLALDPWLNFAGQYTFNPSPMVRCHPPQDNTPTSIKYSDPEPIDVDMWTQTTAEYGGSSAYMMLCVALNAGSYQVLNNGAYWDNLYNFINEIGSTGYATLQNSLTVNPTKINGRPQTPTYYVSDASAADLLKFIVRCGRESDIIGAYYVPDSLVDGSAQVGYPSDEDIDEEPNAKIEISLATVTVLNPVRWSKIHFLPQYKRIYANLSGNVYYYDVAEFFPQKLFPGGGNVTFKIHADLTLNGCYGVYVEDSAVLHGADRFVVYSNVWDRAQLSAYGINQLSIQRNMLNAKSTLMRGALSFLGNAVTAAASLNPSGMVGSFTDLYYTTEENKLDEKETALSAGYHTQAGNNTMCEYNKHFDMITIGVQTPTENEIEKLNTYFGTYGYTMNGKVCPLDSFKAPILPYWYYYHSMNASIEGRNVPQRYLLRVIDMFNRGVFVFRDTASYKNFGLAKDNHF